MVKVNVLSPAQVTALPLSRNDSFQNQAAELVAINTRRWWTVERMFLVVWLLQALLPLALQARSYVQFVKPHQISEILAVSPDQPKETDNISEKCPVEAFILAGVWWNHDPTHYYTIGNTTVCHVVVPQYNTHGNYVIGNTKTTPFYTSPSSCVNDSVPFEIYLYHASIGFFSFYEEEVGTYCLKDKIAYIVVEVLGTYDMNGSFLAEDTGSTKPRISYWYIVIGAIWLTYRILIIRRSYVLCRRYGQRCDSMGERLQLHEAVLFAQESLRLSAHGATNCQRVALLYVIIEGTMTDLFLIIANDGWAIRVQYVSLGYNLSGLVLLLFEILEHTKWLKEKWRLRIKRLFFSYETTLVCELVIAVVFQTIVTGLNKSDFKRSKPTAIAVSYYLWSLICHGAVVLAIISVISAVRVPLAVLYVWFKHGSMLVFSAPCCVDTVLGARSRLMMLGGYCVQNNQLYYKKAALKAFGMLKTEEDCAEYLVMHKLYWFAVPSNNLIVIGSIQGQRVEPCDERICMGDIRFLGQKIGGTSNSIDSHHRNSSISAVKVMAWSGPNDGILPSQTKSQNV